MKTFSIILFNESINGHSADELASRLVKVFKIKKETAQKILRSKRTIFKKNVSAQQVEKYQQALEKIGIRHTFELEHGHDGTDDAVKATKEKEITLTLADDSEEVNDVDSANNQSLASVQAGVPQEKSNSENIYSTPESAAEDIVYCRSCGAEMRASDVVCAKCGAKVEQNSGRSKVAAGFLALLFGGLGLHRFYLRQWWGVFYIVATLGGLAMGIAGSPVLSGIVRLITLGEADFIFILNLMLYINEFVSTCSTNLCKTFFKFQIRFLIS